MSTDTDAAAVRSQRRGSFQSHSATMSPEDQVKAVLPDYGKGWKIETQVIGSTIRFTATREQ